MAGRRQRVLWFKFNDHRGKRWRVYLVRRVNEQRHEGLTDYETRRVLVRYRPSYSEMVATMWHELLHVATSGVDVTHVEHDLLYHSEESVVRRIEPGLAAIAMGLGFKFPDIPDAAASLA